MLNLERSAAAQPASVKAMGIVGLTRSLVREAVGSGSIGNVTGMLGASVAAKLIGLVVLGYPARVLGPAGYGLVGYGASIVAYAGILMSPGLVTWGTREIARAPAQAKSTIATVRTLQLLLASLAYAVVAGYALVAARSGAERSVLLLSGLTLFTTALAFDWVFNGLEMARVGAFINLAGSALNVGLILLLIRTPADVLWYAALPAIVGSATVGVGYLKCRARMAGSRPELAQLTQAARSAFALGLTFALVTILHYANNIIVRQFLGDAALGVYLAGFRLLELVSTIPAVVNAVFLPRLCRVAVSSIETARREAALYTEVLLTVGFLFAAVFFVEADTIVGLLYGHRYAETVGVTKFMGLAVIFTFAISGYTSCLMAFRRDKIMVLVVAASALVSVVGGVVLVPRFGVMGAAAVVATIDLVGWAVALPEYRRCVGSLGFRAWIRPLLGAATVIVVALATRYFGVPPIARLIVAAVVYAPFVVMTAISVLGARRAGGGTRE